MAVPETRLLTPLETILDNSDDWPNFILKDVEVSSLVSGAHVSLLSAHKRNPVRVVGRLDEIEDEFQHLVRDVDYRGRIIELGNVTTYAFAEYDDGTYGFWAAGAAGWFEIGSAAVPYKFIFKQMLEAASMLYMLADKLQRATKKHRMTAKELDKYTGRLFREYLAQGKDLVRFAVVEDVREAFHEHREFLITSMLEGQEGLDWTETPIMDYFVNVFPEEVEQLRARVFPGLPPKRKAMKKDAHMDITTKRKSKSPQIKEAQTKRHKGRPHKQLQSLPHASEDRKSQTFTYGEVDYEDDSDLDIPHKRKSILRPTGNKFAKKAKKNDSGKSAQLASYDSQDNEEAAIHNEKSITCEKSRITTVRDSEHLNQITNPIVDRSLPDVSLPPQYLPRRYLELRVINYDTPTTKPQGPGDLWSCTFEGCFDRIHQASTTTGKMRIEEHWKAHARQAQEKIDLALHESRPYLPVNNLVRRLQAFAPVHDDKLDSNDAMHDLLPPIRRRY